MLAGGGRDKSSQIEKRVLNRRGCEKWAAAPREKGRGDGAGRRPPHPENQTEKEGRRGKENEIWGCE